MKRLFIGNGSRVSALGILALAALLNLIAAPAYSSQQVASLTDFSGMVIIQSRGDWGVKPEKGFPLYSMDKVVTRTGTAVVTFNDGAVLEIRANSNLLIEEQEKTGSVTRNLRLLLGKILFKSGAGSKTQTNLQTPTSVAGLRGTAGTLSIGVDGKSYIQFTEGGTSYTVGDFISGVAKDVPPELADLNPAQRAAFVAAAAADQAKNAAEAAKEGKITDPQAALASAKAAEAAALAAQTSAEAMLNNPDPNVRAQAEAARDAAIQALDAAKEAAKKAIEAGANPDSPATYTPADDKKGPGFDVEPPTTVVNITTTLAPSTTSTPTTTSSSSPSSSAPPTTLPQQDLGGDLDYNDSDQGGLFHVSEGGFDSDESYLSGHLKLKAREEGGYEYSVTAKAHIGEKNKYLFNHTVRTDSSGKRPEGIFAGIWDKYSEIQKGALVGLLFDETAGRFGILKNYDISVHNSISDNVWKAEGVLEFKQKAERPLSANVTQGRLSGVLEGTLGHGGATVINGLSSDMLTETRYYQFSDAYGTKPWGIYSLAMEGKTFGSLPTGENHWMAEIEGYGDFAHPIYDDVPWFTLAEGSWTDDGVITGSMEGFICYGCYESDVMGLGLISGAVFGIGQENYWIAQSVGSWEWVTGIGEFWPSSLYSFDGAEIARIGKDPAKIGIVPRGENEFYFLALGEYSLTGENDGSYLQHTRISGSIEDNTGRGRFEGYIGSVWNDETLDGQITAIRTTSDGSAGILLGDATGGYFSDLGKWKAKGDLVYIPLATDLDPHSITFEERDLTWTGIGSLAEGGTIQVASSKGSTLSITNQEWGVWQTMLAGDYSGTPSDTWTMSLTHQTAGMNHWMEVEGSKWSAEDLTMSAKAAGAWVNWDKAVTGVMGGQLKGTFNPVDSTWQAITAGAQLETSQFMDMIARGQVDALQKLNIPCIQVGKTTLAGNSSLLNVKMNDVTFFSYSTGANPKIWATSNITGTYSGTPSPGHNVNLQSISGGNLNANLAVKNWTNNNWGANVAGSGALNRTDVGGTVNVNFQGAAAGTYGNGNLAGTGSGTVK